MYLQTLCILRLEFKDVWDTWTGGEKKRYNNSVSQPFATVSVPPYLLLKNTKWDVNSAGAQFFFPPIAFCILFSQKMINHLVITEKQLLFRQNRCNRCISQGRGSLCLCSEMHVASMLVMCLWTKIWILGQKNGFYCFFWGGVEPDFEMINCSFFFFEKKVQFEFAGQEIQTSSLQKKLFCLLPDHSGRLSHRWGGYHFSLSIWRV